MAETQVLVVLPTLGDRVDTLRKTLESVNAQRADIDLTLAVVLPDGADVARELAASFGATVVVDPRQGISAAINRGIAARTTETYYAWIGDDDLYRPNGLRRLKEMLDADSGAVLAFGACDYVDADDRIIAVSNAGPLARFLLAWGPDLIPHPGSMIRLDALEAIGRFDESLKYAMDLDALMKLRRFGRFAWTREPVSAFRWHADSLTVANRLPSSLEAERVKRRYLPRALRSLSPLWQRPVRWASAFAANRLNATARRIRSKESAVR